jgi:hypothetical protein
LKSFNSNGAAGLIGQQATRIADHADQAACTDQIRPASIRIATIKPHTKAATSSSGCSADSKTSAVSQLDMTSFLSAILLAAAITWWIN